MTVFTREPYDSVVHKFGRNSAVGTTFVPVCMGGVYRTPQVAAATAVRVKAGNANDTAAGSGAREITVQGLDETGAEVSEAISTAGTSASAGTTATFLRVFRAWVSASGTYATQSAGSHSADVVIENAAGSADWLTIDSTDYARGQSEIAAYTVPIGKLGNIKIISATVDSTKEADLVLFQRASILDTAAPYQAMRIVQAFSGLLGTKELMPFQPIGEFAPLTDLMFMAKVGVGTGTVEIDFEIVLYDA